MLVNKTNLQLFPACSRPVGAEGHPGRCADKYADAPHKMFCLKNASIVSCYQQMQDTRSIQTLHYLIRFGWSPHTQISTPYLHIIVQKIFCRLCYFVINSSYLLLQKIFPFLISFSVSLYLYNCHADTLYSTVLLDSCPYSHTSNQCLSRLVYK